MEPLPLLCWIFVFIKSRGWNSNVEHVPLKDPARNALKAGEESTDTSKVAMLTSNFLALFVFLVNINVLPRTITLSSPGHPH
jgi:hypothetical protein